MKKFLSVLMAAGLLFGGASVATAAKGGNGTPGPNGNNNHGLCTAYFNGQKNGHDKNGQPGPFAALGSAAGDGSDSNSTPGDPADIYDYCQAYGIGGQPDHGRYTCVADDPTTQAADDTTCSTNPAPGNS